MRLLQQLLNRTAAFRTEQAGIAAVEFALIVPIMIMLYIGANEASAVISIDRKVQFISGAVGDLVARTEGSIATGTVDDYVKVASGIASPYVLTDMVQVVSQVFVDNNGVAKIDWSRGYKNQVATSSLNRVKGTLYPLPAAMVAVAKGQFVVVAETSLPYYPLYGTIAKAQITLYRENFFLPRFDGEIKLN